MKNKQLVVNAKYVLFGIFAFLGVSLFDFQPTFVIQNPLTYLLLLLVGVSFLFETFPKHPVLQLVYAYRKQIVLIFSTVLVFSLFGPNLQAQWGSIDDHEIMGYLGVDQRLGVTEIPAILAASETGHPGTAARYRPSYQILRLFEVATWGNNPHLWYGARLVLLIVSLALFWHVITPFVGLIPAGLCMVYLLTYQMWENMFARLGPAETYAVLGMALYVWGYSRIIRALPRARQLSSFSIAAWTVGALICAGTKENFTLLLIPTVILGILVYLSKKRSPAFWTAFAISSGWTLFVGVAFLTAALKAGSDIYGVSMDASSRLSVFILSLKHTQSKLVLLTTLLTAGFAAIQWRCAGRNKRIFRSTLTLLGCLLACQFIFTSQFIFYNADWPNHSRYDFPGVIVIPLFYMALLLFVRALLQEYKVDTVIIRGLQYGVLTGFVCIIVMRGFVPIMVKVKENVNVTKAYTTQIEIMVSVLKQHPERSVVVISGNPWDYEPVHAYSKFLRAYGVTNKLHVQLQGYSPETVKVGLEKQLATELLNKQLKGGGEYLPFPTQMEACYSIRLTQALSDCEQINK